MHGGRARLLCQVMHTVMEEAEASGCTHGGCARVSWQASCVRTVQRHATCSVTVEYIFNCNIGYNLRQFQSVSVAGECVATRDSI
jgi:hypothetical protein